MYQIHLLGYLSQSGYGIHTQEFYSHMKEKYGKNLIFTNLCDLEQTENHQIRYANQTDMIHIIITYGNMCQKQLQYYHGIKICFTVWETTVIPIDWIEPLKMMDRIWIPSNWGRNILIKNGLNADKIDVVPEGVNINYFRPDDHRMNESQKIANKYPYGFKFLNIGKYENRKATRQMIEAFDQEFDQNDQCYLILQCHNQFVRDFNIYQILLRDIRVRFPEKYIIIEPTDDYRKLAEVYQNSDCFVYPTRAEGWGLPLIEALACNLPCITIPHGGQSEYLNYITSDYYIQIPYHLIKISRTDFGSYAFKTTSERGFGEWANFEIKDLRNLMRFAYENPEYIKIMGEKSGSLIRDKFSWDNSVNEAIKVLSK